MRECLTTASSVPALQASDFVRSPSRIPLSTRVEALGHGVRSAARWALALHGVKAGRADFVSAPAPSAGLSATHGGSL